MTTTTIVRRPGDGESTWFLNGLTTKLAGTTETGAAYSLTEQVVTPACDPPLHRHAGEDEAFYVLEGMVEFLVDGERLRATPGTFAFVPRGLAHRFEVRTPTARMLVLCSGKATDNLEDFFFAMGDPAPERRLPEPAAPDMDRLVELAGRSGIEFLA